MHCVDCFVTLCDSFSLLDLQIAASLLASTAKTIEDASDQAERPQWGGGAEKPRNK